MAPPPMNDIAGNSKINTSLYLVPRINVTKYQKNPFTGTIVIAWKPTCLQTLRRRRRRRRRRQHHTIIRPQKFCGRIKIFYVICQIC